jgi:hypothetical protein
VITHLRDQLRNCCKIKINGQIKPQIKNLQTEETAGKNNGSSSGSNGNGNSTNNTYYYHYYNN